MRPPTSHPTVDAPIRMRRLELHIFCFRSALGAFVIGGGNANFYDTSLPAPELVAEGDYAGSAVRAPLPHTCPTPR